MFIYREAGGRICSGKDIGRTRLNLLTLSQPVPLRVERARSTDVFVHIFDSINAMSLKIPPIDSA